MLAYTVVLTTGLRMTCFPGKLHVPSLHGSWR